MRGVILKKKHTSQLQTYSGLKIDFGFGFITLALRLDVENYLKQLIFYLFLRQSVLAPLIQLLLGKLPRGVRKIELDAPQYIEALEKTVANHEYKSCVNALQATINLYLELREELSQSPIVRKVEAERVALQYFQDLIK